MRKVIKGDLFGVSFEVSDDQLKALKQSKEYVRETMRDVALEWHGVDLPKHFQRGARGRYGYAERNRSYDKLKGYGADLISPSNSGHSGALRDALTSSAKLSNKSVGGVSLRMTARALNFVPNSDNPFDTEIVKQSNGRKYPNMKLEVRQITEEESEGLRNLAQTRLAALFQTSF